MGKTTRKHTVKASQAFDELGAAEKVDLKPAVFTGTSMLEFEDHLQRVRSYAQQKGVEWFLLNDVPALPLMHAGNLAAPGVPRNTPRPVALAPGANAQARADFGMQMEIYKDDSRLDKEERETHQRAEFHREKQMSENEKAIAILTECFQRADTDQMKNRNLLYAHQWVIGLRGLFSGEGLRGNAGSQWVGKWNQLELADRRDPRLVVRFVTPSSSCFRATVRSTRKRLQSNS